MNSRFPLLIALLFLPTCGPKVSTVRDVGFDFGRAETYAWLKPDPEKGRLYRNIKPGMVYTIKKAMEGQLANLNLEKGRQPRLHLLFYGQVGSERKVKTITGKTLLGIGDTGVKSNTVLHQGEPFLVLEAYDAASGKLIWRKGVKAPGLDSTDKMTDAVKRAITSLVKQFPQ